MSKISIIQKNNQKLKVISNDVYKLLDDLIDSASDEKRLEKIEMYLEWLKIKTNIVKEEPTFTANLIPYLRRRDVVLINLGFNVGEEFGGEHTAIILRNSSQSNKRVLILPITSQEPKNNTLPIYVKIGKIQGLKDDKIHWANIFNIRAISKQRIICPPNPKKVNNRIMRRINGAINSQIAYDSFDNDN